MKRVNLEFVLRVDKDSRPSQVEYTLELSGVSPVLPNVGDSITYYSDDKKQRMRKIVGRHFFIYEADHTQVSFVVEELTREEGVKEVQILTTHQPAAEPRADPFLYFQKWFSMNAKERRR